MTAAPDPSSTGPLLAGAGLVQHYAPRGRPFGARPGGGVARALNGIDLAVHPGETLALVGESGCGKSTAARCLTVLEPPTAGRVLFRGRQVVTAADRQALRRSVQVVFQDPHGSLNPRLTVGAIVAEPLVVHKIGSRAERRTRVLELLPAVGLEARDAARYPHAFSGGQRQRIAIARALALDPALIVADEPLSALDVSIQSQILNLLADLKERRGLAYLFISHDLAVVDQVADRVAVMYLGRVVETAPRRTLFAVPRHPYTRTLIAAVPRLSRGKRRPGTSPRGEPADPTHPPAGCPFHPRCALAQAMCRTGDVPPLTAVGGNAVHQAACHFANEPVAAGMGAAAEDGTTVRDGTGAAP